MSNEQEIKTFAFLDIETTGLPVYNYGKVRTTELAINTCSGEEFNSTRTGDIPRILGKLVLFFNPMMMIDPESSKITGLTNEMLEHYKKFDENSANIITKFLEHQNEPICLVAHNGNGFDFPIIKKSFERLGLALPSDILCVDSIEIFKKIDAEKEAVSSVRNNLQQRVTTQPKQEEQTIIPKIEEVDKADNIENEVDWEKINEITPNKKIDVEKEAVSSIKNNLEQHVAIQEEQTILSKIDEVDKADDIENELDWEKINEITPNKKIDVEKEAVSTMKNNLQQCDITQKIQEEKTILSNIDEVDKADDIEKELDWKKINETTPKRRIIQFENLEKRHKKTQHHSTNNKIRKTLFSKNWKSYKLIHMYERIFHKKPVTSHAAESDIVTLLQIALHYGEDFSRCAKLLAKPFSEIKTIGFK